MKSFRLVSGYVPWHLGSKACLANAASKPPSYVSTRSGREAPPRSEDDAEGTIKMCAARADAKQKY